MTTYTKLKSGNWGVKVQGSAKPGDVVTVTKKSGETKSERIAKVVWTGSGVAICAIEESSAPRQSGGSRSYGRRTGCSCGSREDSSGCLIDSPRNCRQCEFDAYDN